MVLAASPVWQSATTTSAIKKRLWLSRQNSANCERSQRQRNAMALRARRTQPCAGLSLLGAE
ncbi:hypothetical protein DV515_00012669 [Chloebia gouldiae]|uniref:Uncharacterized protein n=1 Tax=Chloebia gouldiae TaxID=44316 RepID=A0A3L8S368_CHLGU|nr:hypothetical protein DV515_00012669 [Chloebia gouldiae]